MEPYGDHYLLYPGGIYDEELLAENRNDSVIPRALPVMTSSAGKSTTSTLGSANAAPGRTGLKGNTPVIYWKRDKGQATIDDRESHGIIPYRKGLFYHGAYVVLSRTTSEENNYWSLSVFKKSDYVPKPTDIIIAYGFKNTIQNIWSSDVHYNKKATGNPFEVKFEGVENAGEENEQAIFSVVPGTINNKVPSNIADPITISEDKYVYLAAYTDVGESDEYLIAVQIVVDVEENKPDTDDYGYLKLAKISPDGTVTQYVSGSVWSERHKYTEPDSATYYYYRV
jgi:hypothetical protein